MHSREDPNNAQLCEATGVSYAMYAKDVGLGTAVRYMAGSSPMYLTENTFDPANSSDRQDVELPWHTHGVAEVFLICCPTERPHLNPAPSRGLPLSCLCRTTASQRMKLHCQLIVQVPRKQSTYLYMLSSGTTGRQC